MFQLDSNTRPRFRRVISWAIRAGAVGILIAGAVVLQSGVASSGYLAAPDATTATAQGFGYALNALTGAPISGAAFSVGGVKVGTSDATGAYTLSGLSTGEKVGVVSASGYAPTGVVFSVHAFGTGGTSVHVPPAYLVPAKPVVMIPAGGSLSDAGVTLSFATGGFAASLTTFGANPGPPAPPDTVPFVGDAVPPRTPSIPKASSDEHAFPQAAFYTTFPAGVVASVLTSLAVPGADPPGSALALLRFDIRQGLWIRVGDLTVNPGGASASGTLSTAGLYMVVTSVVINTDSLIVTDETVEISAPLANNSFSGTLPATFTIGSDTSPETRAAAFWYYGWREGSGNSIGIQINFGSGLAPADVQATPFPHPCPQGIKCEPPSTPCIILGTNINGCGASVSVPGFCGCCQPGQSCGVILKAKKAEDKYEIGIGLERIPKRIDGKGEKRKEDLDIRFGCYVSSAVSQAKSIRR